MGPSAAPLSVERWRFGKECSPQPEERTESKHVVEWTPPAGQGNRGALYEHAKILHPGLHDCLALPGSLDMLAPAPSSNLGSTPQNYSTSTGNLRAACPNCAERSHIRAPNRPVIIARPGDASRKILKVTPE